MEENVCNVVMFVVNYLFVLNCPVIGICNYIFLEKQLSLKPDQKTKKMLNCLKNSKQRYDNCATCLSKSTILMLE